MMDAFSKTMRSFHWVREKFSLLSIVYSVNMPPVLHPENRSIAVFIECNNFHFLGYPLLSRSVKRYRRETQATYPQNQLRRQHGRRREGESASRNNCHTHHKSFIGDDLENCFEHCVSPWSIVLLQWVYITGFKILCNLFFSLFTLKLWLYSHFAARKRPNIPPNITPITNRVIMLSKSFFIILSFSS